MNVLPNTYSPYDELVSYETLWGMRDSSRKTLTAQFHGPSRLPSAVLRNHQSSDLFDLGLNELKAKVEEFLSSRSGFSVCCRGGFQFPRALELVPYPPQLLYYRGDLGLVEAPSVSVVGSRAASPDGLEDARRIAEGLVDAKIVVVSGIAAGIDTAAMEATIRAGGHTIGVIGTPIDRAYPRANEALQEVIARDHLLMSLVPLYRYDHEPFAVRRRYFPERNEVMAALSLATVIVEASDTSGTLIQARECLRQRRPLYIMNRCFEMQGLKWPQSFVERGAIRVRTVEDLVAHARSLSAAYDRRIHVEKD